MTEYEFEYWQEVTQNSKYRWMEDAITRLNGNGMLFYTGGEEGVYMRVSPENKLTVGIYEDAFPHVGDALFKIKAEHLIGAVFPKGTAAPLFLLFFGKAASERINK